jgi:hypothetical protein
MKSLFGAALAVGLALLSAAAPAQEDRTRIRGTIESVDGSKLMLAGEGDAKMTLTLDEGAHIIAVGRFAMIDVVAGSYVGVAATRQSDGSFKAREIHVFDESMRGAGEGQRPMPGDDEATMTNGTVGEVTGTDEKSMTVSFHGDKTTIAIGPDTPVVELAPGDSALLVPGAHVMAFARDEGDGAYSADFILVGRDGVVPPM